MGTQLMPTPGIVALLNDIFDIRCHTGSAEEISCIMPSADLFHDKQFLDSEKLRPLMLSQSIGEMAIITDRLFISWILVKAEDSSILVGPFSSFQENPYKIRKALRGIGYESDSLTPFRKYQNNMQNISQDMLGRLIKFLTKGIAGDVPPMVNWVNLFDQEVNTPESEVNTNPYAEKTYLIESEYMEAIYMGDTQKATDVLLEIQNRFKNMPDNNHNAYEISLYGQAVNCTLARLAAYQAGVHPVILDEIFQKHMMLSIQEKSPMDQLKQAFVMTANVCDQVKNYRTANYSPLIKKTISYINEHYSESIHQDAVADIMGVHRNYLSRVFSRETGKTFSKYLLDTRLEIASSKLRMTNIKVYEIAESVGIPDYNYFSRVFKKRFGKSPSEYRRN